MEEVKQTKEKQETKEEREARIRKENEIITDVINNLFKEAKQKENKNS